MYYLLEDNRIIDMNNIRSQKEFIKEFIEENGKLKELTGFNLSSIGLQKFYNDVYVKNQSENVYDLIEIGDLIKYQFINGYYELVSTVELVTEINIVFKQKEYIGVLGKEVDKNKDTILAIYKPDSKENYIKVWEKKDE